MEREELKKLTVTKLRELALERYPEIKGVSAMSKDQLIDAIIAEEVRLGLRPPEVRKTRKPPVASELKARIRLLKKERDQALEVKDRGRLEKARAEIKRMKRLLRKLREEVPAPVA